jgi:hypothetical protein
MLKSNEKQSQSPKITKIVQYSLTKWLTRGLWRCLFTFCKFFTYIFCFVSQVLCICTDDRRYFSMRNILFLIVMILYYFYLIIWWSIGIASESKLEVLKDEWFSWHNCFYFFLFFCLITLFHSNIPYIPIHEYVWVLTAVFVWRWTHTRGYWIISSMTIILKIVLW